MDDLTLLARDKYDGDADRITPEDRARLDSGEPLAYVIGWVPFLGLRIELASKPLIPRPETEWWTELAIEHVREGKSSGEFRVLDLCAGSGAIGLALLHALPAIQVSFSELVPKHAEQIRTNLSLPENRLDYARANIRTSDLFSAFGDTRFDLIVTNPPYIPEARTLENSVTDFEPSEALFSGPDGLDVIRRIAKEAPAHMHSGGELWMECDVETISEAARLLREGGAIRTDIRTDLYGRERVVVAYY